MHAIRRLVPVSLLAVASAFAQDTPAPPEPAIPPVVTPVTPPGQGNPATPGQGNPTVPVPGSATGPGGRPAVRPVTPGPAGAQINQENLPLEERKVFESIIQPKLNGNELAALYKKYTGRRVIVSSAAAQAEFSFVQEASPTDPLTYNQVTMLLKKAALLENFVFVPDGEVDKLLLATGGPNPKGVGVSIYNESDVLPEGDEVIAYVMTFKFLKPEAAQQVFNQVVGQFGAFGSIAAVPNASALVITENTSLIRKLIQLKDEIDKATTDVTSRFIKVQYADVSELAQTLNELLNTQQQSAQRTAGVQRTEINVAPGGQAGGAAAAGQGRGTAGEDTPVQIVPDARTNRIFAMGRPVDVVFVEGLVREFDTQTDAKNFLRRKLRFLSVNDFLGIAGDALTRAFTGTGSGGQGGGAGGPAGTTSFSGSGGGRGGSGTQNNSRGGTGGNRSGSFGTSATSGSSSFGGSGSSGGFGGSGGSGGTGGGSALSDPNVSTAPQSLLVGRTLLVADNITNSIVVQGPPASVEIIERLLDQVDVKAEQVMISTIFGQLTLNDDLDYGVEWLRTFKPKTYLAPDGTVVTVPSSGFAGGNTNGGWPTSGTPAGFVNPSSLLSPSNFPTGVSGLNVYGTIAKHFNVYLQALESTGRFSVLSRPSIVTANNQKGMISSGQRIAVPTSTYNGGTTGSNTNIEYRDVVLKLEVIPLVNSKTEITLQIALLNDDVVGTQNIEGVGDVPIIGTRELTTRVTIQNNATVVLGGLITTTDKDAVSGIPILSSIPYLGKLFSTTSKEKDRSELVVFIQPSIIHDQDSSDAVQADAAGRYELSPDIHKLNEGPGVLPPPDGVTPVTEEPSRGSRRTSSDSKSSIPSSSSKKKVGAIGRR